MSGKSKSSNSIKTTKRSFELIEGLKEMGGAGVTELANRLDMSKSVVHNHLNTLRDEEYVVKRNDKYALSLKFLELGGYTRKQMPIYTAAREPMAQLAEETGELINLMTESSGYGVYLYRAKGDNAVDLNTYTGFQTHLHITALGKSIMSQLSEEEWMGYVEKRGLPAATENTITDTEALRERLRQIEEQGYTIDNSERLEGVRCVAAPIEGQEGVAGAISVSAPEGRLSLEQAREETQRKVRNTANVIELEMRY